MSEIKELLIELLDKYSDSEGAAISEYSIDCAKDFEELREEVDSYRAKIEQLTEEKE